ncbi:MAG: L,D-transpeptidase [bacterium]
MRWPALLLLPPLLMTAPLQARRPTGSPRRERPSVTPLTVVVEHRTDLFAAPGKRGTYVGTAARGTRLPVMRIARGGRCPLGRWYEVAAGAWMCAAHGRGSWRLPHATPQPVVRSGRLVPRVAYYARRDGVPIYTSEGDAASGRHDRLVERGFSFSVSGWLRVGTRRFLRTRRGELVPRQDMWRYRPSTFSGRPLTGRPPPRIGCTIQYKHAPVHVAPLPGARRAGRLPHHSWVELLEQQGHGRGRFYRIGQDRWIAARHVRPVHFSAPPRGVGPRERWVEVLLRHQTLVAYEGHRPVYATLVSTGRWEHRTPRGLFRVRTKVTMSTMTSRKGAGELYRVDDVPWIQYFHEGYALHGTYWHDRFGHPKSHGCINLAPTDARWLFRWTPPGLRPGWAAREMTSTQPGILVRVRNTVRQQVRYRGPSALDPATNPTHASR